MKIALAQMDVKAGMPKKNLETMLRMTDSAKEEGADLVVFPEMAVGGYLVGDKWLSDSFTEDLMEYNEDLVKASDGIAIAYGNVFVDQTRVNEDGRARKFNAVYVAQDGKMTSRMADTPLPDGVVPKVLLPNYRIFDDKRYFYSLADHARDLGVPLNELVQPVLVTDKDGNKVPIGFETCEDLWCADYKLDGKPINVSKMLVDNGAEMIVNLSASPWTYGKNDARDRRVKFVDTGKPFLYANCCGAQNNGKNVVTFDGGTTAYNANGDIVDFIDTPYKEGLLTIDDKVLAGATKERPQKGKIDEKYDAIIRGIQHMKDIRGVNTDPKYVIGLSGGIDSAVVSALLVDAVGADNVMAVNMPTHYNSKKTKDSAKQTADKLGIEYRILPIQEMVNQQEEVLDKIDYGTGRELTTLNKENIQAKIRGTSVLSNLAAKEGAIFTNNGNKVELALGYATLYGDIGGAIAPIADLTKTEVFELAKYINERNGDEVVPEKLIPDELCRFGADQIRPAAELKDAQVDPMKFGYHCALINAYTDYMKKGPEQVLEWYKDGVLTEKLGIDERFVERYGLDKPEEFVRDLEWFTRGVDNNVFKRVQAPPVVMTSKSAFGYDIRESQLPYEPTRKFERLKEEVLKLDKYQKK